MLYTACQRYGVPVHLISDSGGAFISDAFEGVCTRLAIDHQTIVSTAGQSYMNLMETHFNIQRRLYDYQLALTRTPHEFDEAHQQFLAPYNTTAHQGLLKEGFASPIPLHVLGESKGRPVPPQELARKFAQALCAHHQSVWVCHLAPPHFYVDDGVPQTPIPCGWLVRNYARCMTTSLAEYACHYDLRTGTAPASAWGNGIPARLQRGRPRACCWSAPRRTPDHGALPDRTAARRLLRAGRVLGLLAASQIA